MNKSELLEAVRTARGYLLKTIENLSSEEITQSATLGNWSVKDTLSHIAGWDAWVRVTMQTIFEGTQPDLSTAKNIDESNAKFIAKRSSWPIEQILIEMTENQQHVFKFVEGLSEEEFFKPRIFDDQNWSLDGFFNVWKEHDIQHADKILLWRRKQKTL